MIDVALFGWIPVILGLFAVLSARRAVLASFLGAWLFLPMAGVKIAAGIPVFQKMTAACAGVMLAMVLFDLRRLTAFRPALLDVLMLIWCACPLVSSLANGLGVYDGVSATISQTVTWGMPYLIGRVYFGDQEGLNELAVGMFIGGLVYVPLCLIEIRMSPQLHNWVYGYQQHQFAQSMRFGGYRPTVFMQHGLMVGMWMCMTALIGLWLWYTRSLKYVQRMPVVWGVMALLVTAILCKSVGAMVLLVAGLAGLAVVVMGRTQVLIWVLIVAAPAYMVVRGTGIWDASQLVSSAEVAGGARSDSLAFRVKNENILAAKARLQPVFGWGGWGRARVLDKYGSDISVTDGLWIIALGNYGIVGLGAWTLAMLLPAALVVRRFRAGSWCDPQVAPAAVLAVVLILYVIDCVPNGMVNPIFTLCAGGLASLAVSQTITASAEQIVAVPSPVLARRRMAVGAS